MPQTVTDDNPSISDTEMRLMANSPSMKHTARSPSLGSNDLSMTISSLKILATQNNTDLLSLILNQNSERIISHLEATAKSSFDLILSNKEIINQYNITRLDILVTYLISKNFATKLENGLYFKLPLFHQLNQDQCFTLCLFRKRRYFRKYC